ncbi:leucine-rich repeat-containing protein 37A2-like [Thomomys bottae]
MEVGLSPTIQETLTDHSTPPTKFTSPAPFSITAPATTQSPVTHKVTFEPVDLLLSVISEPTSEAEYSPSVSETTAPPQMTFPLHIQDGNLTSQPTTKIKLPSTMQKVPTEPLQETSSEALQETTTQPWQEISTQSLLETPTQHVQEIPTQTTEKLLSHHLQETTTHHPQATPTHHPLEISTHHPQGTPTHHPQGTPTHHPLETITQYLQETSTHHPLEISTHHPQGTPTHHPQEIPTPPLQESLTLPLQEIPAQSLQATVEQSLQGTPAQPGQKTPTQNLQENKTQLLQETPTQHLQETKTKLPQDTTTQHQQETLAQPIWKAVTQPKQKAPTMAQPKTPTPARQRTSTQPHWKNVTHPTTSGRQPMSSSTKAAHGTTLKNATTLPPKQRPVTLPHPHQIQTQHPTLTQVTAKTLSLQQRTTTHFSTSTTENALAVHTEHNALPSTNLCSLCNCQDQTLSCVDLSPGQKLRHVPVPDIDPKKQLFTVLIFQGNDISYIEENIWRLYCWTEKLILSENRLTELHKDTFEGLLSLEYLILPHQIAGCLCQYKNNIEVICKTVKLHCDSILLMNITYCLEEESIGNPEGTFMKVLKVRKRNNSTELIIEPEREYLDKNDASYSGFMNEHIELNNENEISSALNNILPYLSQGHLYDARATLLPFIKLLLSNEKNGDNYMDNTKTNIRRPPVKPESNKNNLNKLNILENLLNSEIKKNYIWKKMGGTEKRLPRLNRVFREPKSIQKRHFKKVNKQNIWMKQSGQPVVENIAKERFRRLPLRELHVSQKPRKLIGDSLPTEPSFTKGFKAAASSLLKPDPVGSRASTFTIEKPLDEVQNRAKTLSYTRFALDGVNSRVKSIKASNPILASPQNDDIHKTGSPVAHRIPKAKRNRKFRKKTLLFRPVHANRPPFSGARSLINSPSGGDFSSLGELNSQENTFPEFYAISNPSIDITLPKRQITTNAFVKNIPVLGGSLPKNTIHENFAAPGSSVTALNLMPPAQQTDETVWEHLGIDSSLKAIDSQSQFTSFGDHFEMQLNQQLKPLIPNNDVRKLLSQLIWALKMDCSESGMQAACTKLISRSGLLMKLLSKSQEVKLSKAEWDTDQWKTDNYINESTEVQGIPKESSELIQEVPGYGFNNKIILAVAVVLVVMMLIIIFCLIEICCHRRATEEGKESTRGFFWFLRRQGSSESECQDGFFLGRPLWLRDMYRPLSATSKKNMAKKLHDKDSSDEDEIFQKKEKKSSETAIEMPPPTSSTGTNAMEESENAGCCGMFPSKKN